MPESPTTPLPLNSTALRNRVAAAGLRQWWLAEQLGVDRRTVMRWMNGQVRGILPAHARALAAVLGCELQDLLMAEPATELASADDQRAAGLALARTPLLEHLGPVGEWELAESLLKAAAVPDLPVHVLGRLYHELCVACWRQDRLDDAEGHNRAARAAAERCGDQALLGDVLGSEANLAFWRGRVADALQAWDRALALAPWLSPRQLGSLHCNRGASLREIGDLDAARRSLRASAQAFDREASAMNLAILHAQLALVALDEGDAEAAEREARCAEGHARRGSYRRGLALAPLLLAEVAARRGQAERAGQALDTSRQAYAALGLDEAFNHLRQARVWRLLGNHDTARAAAARSLVLARGWPVEEAAARDELARIDGAVSPPVTLQRGVAPLP